MSQKLEQASKKETKQLERMLKDYGNPSPSKFVALFLVPWEDARHADILHRQYSDKKLDEWVQSVYPYTQSYDLVLEARQAELPAAACEQYAAMDQSGLPEDDEDYEVVPFDQEIDTATLASIEFLSELEVEELLVYPPIDFIRRDPSKFEVEDWLQDEPDLTRALSEHTFIAFGADGTGGQFCLWYYPGLEEVPPVLFLSSEGELEFVAGSVEDFLRITSLGKVFECGWDDPDPEMEELSDFSWKDFKSSIDKQFGESDSNFESILRQGKTAHSKAMSEISALRQQSG